MFELFLHDDNEKYWWFDNTELKYPLDIYYPWREDARDIIHYFVPRGFKHEVCCQKTMPATLFLAWQDFLKKQDGLVFEDVNSDVVGL